MKFFISIIAFAAVVLITQSQLYENQEKQERSDEDICLQEPAVDSKVFQEAKRGEFPDDVKLKEYFFCITKRHGMINEAGEFQKRVLLKEIGKSISDSATIQKLVDTCAVQKSTPVETAFEAIKCFAIKIGQYHTKSEKTQLYANQEKQVKTDEDMCLQESAVDSKVLQEASRGEFPDDVKLKEYFFCISKRHGLINEAGEFQMRELIKEIGKLIIDSATTHKLVDACAVQKSTPVETAFEAIKCFAIKIGQYRAKSEKTQLYANQEKQVKSDEDMCLQESAVDSKVLQEASRGEFPDDVRLKEYFFCISKRHGVINEAGEFQMRELIKEIGKLIIDSATTHKLVDACAVQKSTPVETAFEAIKCIAIKSGLFRTKSEKGEEQTCLEESGVDSKVLQHAKSGKFSDDIKLKEHIFCVAKRDGIINEAGELRRDLLLKKLGKIITDPATRQKLVDLCALQRSTPRESAFEMVKCVYVNVRAHQKKLEKAEKQKKEMESHQEACLKESDVDSEEIKKAKKGEFSDNITLKEYIFCITKKSGIINEAGEFQKHVLLNGLVKIINDSVTSQKFVDECAVQKSTPQESAYEAIKCLNIKTRAHFKLNKLWFY